MPNTIEGSGSLLGSGDITAELPTLLGGLLSSDSTYYYRTFTSTANLTATGEITADVLVIAGGGAGGAYSDAGGGGCGTVTLFSQQSLSKGTYACTVAAPSGNSAQYDWTKNGNPSKFGSLSSVTGGGTGHASYDHPATLNGGTYQGGGAGSETGIVPGYPNKTGGNGTSAYSSWLSAITSQMTSVSGWSTATSGGRIAGGGSSSKSPGASSPGGLGGGGEGAPPAYSNNNSGGNAVTNTGSGGGGGGSYYYNTGGSGASGLIILRWLK